VPGLVCAAAARCAAYDVWAQAAAPDAAGALVARALAPHDAAFVVLVDAAASWRPPPPPHWSGASDEKIYSASRP